MDRGYQHKCRYVNRKTTPPHLTDQRKLAGKPGYDWSQRRPCEIGEDAPCKYAPRGVAHTFRLNLEIDRACPDHSEHRPGGNDDEPRLQISPTGHRTYTIQ